MLRAKQLKERPYMFPIHPGNKSQKGFSVIEILVSSTVLLATMGVLMGFASFSLGAAILYKQTAQASSMAQEAMEAVRSFRNEIVWNQDDPSNAYDGLGVMLTGTPYYPRTSSDIPPKWQFIQGQETIGIFTRTVTFSQAQRNAQQDLVESGGTPDPDTKKITVQVLWNERSRPHSVSLASYLTNWK